MPADGRWDLIRYLKIYRHMTLSKTNVIIFHPGNKEKIQTQYPICNEKYEKK
jgi:hypothetical protein